MFPPKHRSRPKSWTVVVLTLNRPKKHNALNATDEVAMEQWKDLYSASDRLVSGLFSRLLNTLEEALGHAVELAMNVAEKISLMSTKLMRDLMIYCPDTPDETHFLDSMTLMGMAESADNIEALQSYMQKRTPEFAGNLDRSDFPFWP
ncbi:Enoyl-CoA hydratase AFT3-1 [Colletotrichum spinosum]|uniref:Enoyl-CoA hydratase AFT3-1 n=1 Tax=Colletotrichum spinosum TaxID=1347390 RepID=A0A4R8QIP9_9PEZI|nr:Enoyl-CoA hydratase AFT3-1 [Colletotrichum spinosum]